nr:hypothetical protein [Tanacetum cinerariifolium]
SWRIFGHILKKKVSCREPFIKLPHKICKEELLGDCYWYRANDPPKGI